MRVMGKDRRVSNNIRAIAEALPGRKMLSGEPYITYNATTKHVTVAGTPDGNNVADVVIVDRIGNDYHFSIDLGNDSAGPYSAIYAVSAVQQMNINTFDGDDIINANGGANASVQAGAGNDTLFVRRLNSGTAMMGNMGDGDDAIHYGVGQLDPIDGITSLGGAAGFDTLYLDDSLGTSTTYTSNGGVLRRPDMGWGAHYFNGAEASYFRPSAQGSTINMQSMWSGTKLVIEGSTSNEVIKLANNGNNISELDGFLTIHGNGGADQLIANDAGFSATATAYSVTSSTLGREGMTPVTFSGVNVQLFTGTGADTVDVSLATPLNLMIDGGSNPVSSPDTLSLAASASNATHDITASPTGGTWTLPSIGSVSYTNVEDVRSSLLVQSIGFDRDALAIEVGFAGDVGATLDPSDLALRDTQGMIVPVESFSYDSATRRAAFGLSSTALPPDGHYTAELGTGFNNGAASLVSPRLLSFDFLRGDANGNGSVDFDDLLIVAQNFGLSSRTASQGNVDYSADGVVNFDDLLLIAQRYGTSLVLGERSKNTTRQQRLDSILLA